MPASCTVTGCEKPSRSQSAALCKMHYHRQYRHGDVDKVAHTSGVSASHGRRYRRIYVPGHPLADAGGAAYEHRVVLYAVIGPGDHRCHWCGHTVTWAKKGTPHCLQVDHLNGVGDDNRAANLVPACNGCNSTRALQARSDALRAAGFWANNDTVGKNGRRARINPAA